MNKDLTITNFVKRDYNTIYRDYLEEKKTGNPVPRRNIRIRQREMPKGLIMRRQFVKNYRSKKRPYYISIRAMTSIKGVNDELLRRCVLEMELSLKKQGLLDGFKLEYNGFENIEVTLQEGKSLLRRVKCEVMVRRDIIKETWL